MDAIVSAFCQPRMKAAAILIIVSLYSVPLPAQTSNTDPDNFSELKQLVTEERWQEIVQRAEAIEPRTVELNYYYGIALAQLGRGAEAETIFKQGLKQQPGDKRFPLELAGVYFRPGQSAAGPAHSKELPKVLA
jgi:hypothetical protein